MSSHMPGFQCFSGIFALFCICIPMSTPDIKGLTKNQGGYILAESKSVLI